MVNHPLRRFIVVIAAVVLLLAVVSGQVLAQDSGTVDIVKPAVGETVSGLITVAGTVTFPDFLKYELFLKKGEELIWAATVYSPVVQGNLARLDTRTFVDGSYQMVIRQVGADSQYVDIPGPTFTISNELGAPLPFPEVEPNFLYPVESKALVRVRNCSGEDLMFDYGSPEGFREAGQINLPPKPETAICPFTDLALQPAEYRGTGKGGGQAEGVTYSFIAEAGKVYQIIYNGPAAGANQLYIGPVEGDEPDRISMPASPATTPVAGAAPAVDTIVAAPTAAAPAVSDPSASGEALGKTQAMLPVSGQGSESRTAFMFAGVVLILLLVVGGLWAANKRNYTA